MINAVYLFQSVYCCVHFIFIYTQQKETNLTTLCGGYFAHNILKMTKAEAHDRVPEKDITF